MYQKWGNFSPSGDGICPGDVCNGLSIVFNHPGKFEHHLLLWMDGSMMFQHVPFVGIMPVALQTFEGMELFLGPLIKPRNFLANL